MWARMLQQEEAEGELLLHREMNDRVGLIHENDVNQIKSGETEKEES